MHTLVLSGGGNFGAMQAGALCELIQADIEFELVVGTSAGGLNAIQIAADPTAAGAARLVELWRAAGRTLWGGRSVLSGLQQLVLDRSSLYPSQPLADLVREALPADVQTFGDLRRLRGKRVYTLAVGVHDGKPHLFGDDESDRVLDGAMASSALPPFFPPWRVGDHYYLDGGLHGNLPLRAAVARGASSILALWIHTPVPRETGGNIVTNTTRAVAQLIENLSRADLDWAHAADIPIRLVELRPPETIAFWDFSQAEAVVEAGQVAAREAIDRGVLEQPRTSLLEVVERAAAWLNRDRQSPPESG